MFTPTFRAVRAQLRDRTVIGFIAQTRTDNIAEKELLTKEVLIREIKKETVVSKRVERKICRYIRLVMKSNAILEQEVIYIFLRLWFLREVEHFNFMKSFEKNKSLIQRLWRPRYGRIIEKCQKERIIV